MYLYNVHIHGTTPQNLFLEGRLETERVICIRNIYIIARSRKPCPEPGVVLWGIGFSVFFQYLRFFSVLSLNASFNEAWPSSHVSCMTFF